MGEAKRKRELARNQMALTEVSDAKATLTAPAADRANVVIVQLSDIHIGRTSDIILKRAEAIARVTNTVAHGVDVWVLLVTGDIAKTGKSQDYTLATSFLSDIRAQIARFHPQSKVHIIALPGNHDCDFALDTAARQMMLPSVHSKLDALDASVLDAMLTVQTPFFEFLSQLEGATIAPQLIYRRRLDLGRFALAFTCYNSAWLSQIKEKPGDLAIPVPSVDEANNATVSVCAFHHTLPWLRTENRRAFQAYVERTSDLIFTGHEHVLGAYNKTNQTGESVDYYEGGALQPEDRPSESVFSMVEIDIGQRTHRLTTHRWDRNQYVRAQRFPWKPFVFGTGRHTELAFTDAFERVLSDPGAQFTHPARDTLFLDDIFVYPDVQELKIPPTSRSLATIASFSEISRRIGPSDLSRVLIFGADGIGKTTLAKKLCRDLTQRNFVALVALNGSFKACPATEIESFIRDRERLQYGERRAAGVAQVEPERRVLILDGLAHERGQLSATLDTLAASFGTIVVLGGDLLKLRDLPHAASDKNPFIGFKRFEILPFGHARRAKLVDRWFEISRQGGAEEEVVERKKREASEAVAIATNSDFVPPYPLPILIILQTFEAASSHQGPAASSRSYGYLHEALIMRALSDNAPIDVDTSHEYLAELAFSLFSRNLIRLSGTELRRHHDGYCQEYRVTLSFDSMIAFLLRVGVLCAPETDTHEFKYKYLYHYFVARALARNTSRFESHIDRLADTLHREQSASIVMYLVHLRRDDRVVEKMLAKARSLYADVAQCDLEEDVAPLSELHHEQELVLPSTPPEENREALLKAQDDAALASASDQNDDARELDAVVRVNSALKTLEVLGQVVKSFPGSTKGDRKREIVTACYSLGLRAMKAFVDLITENRQEIVRDVERFLREKGIASDEIGGKASHFVFWLSEAWVLLFLIKTAQGVGLTPVLT